MNTIQTAKVVKNPSSPIASKINPEEFRVNVEVQYDNAETERIYFTHGSDLDYLEVGDVVFVQQNKKTKTITLTPELAARLKSRREKKPKPPTPAPAPAPEPQPPTAAFMDVAEIALIYKALRREIPEASDECICNLAQSVFKYRRQQ